MLNRAMIIGYLGADPDIRSTPNGDRVANFTIEKWKDHQTGERRERTEWHRVTIWNENIVKVVEAYVKKGSRIYIDGQLQTRKWQDKDGIDRYTTEIVLKPYRGQIELLDSKNSNDNNDSGNSGGSGGGYGQSNSGGGDYANASGGSSAYGGASQSHQRPLNDDDDVPF